jgi:hypothetical protein
VHAAQATFAAITAAQQEAGVAEVSLLNFALSDGATLLATRYVSHEHEEAASLYYAEGSAFQARMHFSRVFRGFQGFHERAVPLSGLLCCGCPLLPPLDAQTIRNLLPERRSALPGAVSLLHVCCALIAAPMRVSPHLVPLLCHLMDEAGRPVVVLTCTCVSFLLCSAAQSRRPARPRRACQARRIAQAP